MSRMVGTVSMGIRAPIIRSGDDLAEIVTGSVLEAVKDGAFSVRDRDVVAMTEAIVARAQGNYASVDDIAADVKAKLGGETIGVIFPILSRNRFAICLRGIAKGAKKIVLMLSYPSDEVGNHLIDEDVMDEKGVDPYKDVLSLERYRELFGYTTHPFTGVDYVDYYSNLIRESGAPVVPPAYTAGLEGTPNELKLKYLADNDFAALSGEALREAIKGEIKKKDGSLVGKMAAQGTTPRRLTDLIGSLCDLTSGSGDKGTPIVYIQGYFDNYTTE